jgi:hypothetical protein
LAFTGAFCFALGDLTGDVFFVGDADLAVALDFISQEEGRWQSLSIAGNHRRKP